MSDRQSGRRPNPVAIRANHFALSDFLLSLRDAFGVADVERLLHAWKVVELKCDRVATVAAVYTPMFQLVGIEPISNGRGASVPLRVHPLSVAGGSEATLSPRPPWRSRERPFWPGPLAALLGAILGLSLSGEAVPAAFADLRSWGDVDPRGHVE